MMGFLSKWLPAAANTAGPAPASASTETAQGDDEPDTSDASDDAMKTVVGSSSSLHLRANGMDLDEPGSPPMASTSNIPEAWSASPVVYEYISEYAARTPAIARILHSR